MDKFTFGIMGAGKIAVKFTEAARLCGAEVVAVSSKSGERASSFAEKNGIAKSYGSYAEMLSDARPDCVYIATTPDSHYEIAMLCIANKTPLLCEKAMFTCAGQAESAMVHAKANGVFMMEGLWSRFLPANEQAKRWLDSGAVGEPRMCDVAIGFNAPEGDDNRYWNPALAGGAACDITVYAYELARYYIGGEQRDTAVNCVAARTGVDLSETAIFIQNAGFNGTSVDVPTSLRTSFGANLADRAAIYGSRGRIEVPHPHWATEALLYGENGELLERFEDSGPKNGFVYEIAEVISRVRAGDLESPTVPWSLTRDCAKLFDDRGTAF